MDLECIKNQYSQSNILINIQKINHVATLALGSPPRQELARLLPKRKLGVKESVRE
jgi:hypothetical protein